MFFLIAAAAGHASDVLIIYDTTAAGTGALTGALEGAGFTVTLSDTDETGYDGSNPSPYDFQAVIHLNGTTYSTSMPTSGQQALVDYVNDGGGFISTEWNAYEREYSTMETMSDLILLSRSSGREGGSAITYDVVKKEAGHPVLDGIPSLSLIHI